MALRTQLNVQLAADLPNFVINDGQVILIPGNTAWDDQPFVYYYWDVNSSATADGYNVIQPTSVLGNGRYIRLTKTQTQSDWSASSGVSYIANKPSLATVATSGSYSDLLNKPTIPNAISSVNNGVSRTINGTGFQVSTTLASNVNYTVQIAATLSLTTGQTGTVFLETSPNNSTWTEVTRFSNGNTGSLTIGLNLTQTLSVQLNAYVPAGYYVRLRQTGAATISYITGQEILY